MNNLTVLYYSANVEDPFFEAKIREKLIASMGDLPLVSVTQEPAPGFGHNICVGRHHPCYGNEFRQIQIGLRAVKTDYVITAEADCLYPPEYFKFQPTSGDCYRYGNVWMNYVRPQENSSPKEQVAFFKKYSDSSQIVRKDFWLDFISKMIGNEERWFDEKDKAKKTPTPETKTEFTWTSESPVITFKTLKNVSRFSSIISTKEIKPLTDLPYWGNISKLKKRNGDMKSTTTKNTELCEIAYKYGTDKCPAVKHSYTPFYYQLLKDKRQSVKKVLELGVGRLGTMRGRYNQHYRKGLIYENPWPDVPSSEKEYGRMLFKDPNARCAYWGKSLDRPKVRHIGKDRTGFNY